jgi:hypothetical protein
VDSHVIPACLKRESISPAGMTSGVDVCAGSWYAAWGLAGRGATPSCHSARSRKAKSQNPYANGSCDFAQEDGGSEMEGRRGVARYATMYVDGTTRPCVVEPISNGTPTGQPSTPRQHDDLCASVWIAPALRRTLVREGKAQYHQSF